MRHIIRIASVACALMALPFAGQGAWAGSALPIASAQPRVPQAVVHGGVLQGYLNGVGESIVVSSDQIDVGLLTAGASSNSTFTIQVELGANVHGIASGIYNGHDPYPALMQIFPAGASIYWFAVISFRTAPTRAVVNVFDESAALAGTTTYLGADRQAIGFYVQGAGGTFYSQDARNPGAAPQLLFFRGTGINLGSAWMAVEDQPAASAGGADYDDVIWFVEPIAPCVRCDGNSELTPVENSSWGELKARFH